MTDLATRIATMATAAGQRARTTKAQNAIDHPELADLVRRLRIMDPDCQLTRVEYLTTGKVWAP